MSRFAGLILSVFLLPCLAASPVIADHIDGMSLKLTHGTIPGGVTLDWTGGQPGFRVYRSTSKSLIVDPSNLIGTTDVRTFDDTPPAGAVFFYEIASACGYNPPEVCNGVDDDCDGTVDGPGSEASCSLPNAAPACVAGACAVAACIGGYGDCDAAAANGCEAPLGLMQSTSPSSLWAGDPNPDKDLAPGFFRVATIKNCGGCGVTCDDGISCTTDLCVPDQQAGGVAGTCRHYKRGQCAEARCGGDPLPPGTPIPGDPACTAPDSDGDGLSDPWETPQPNPYDGSIEAIGIDLDCDGEISASDNDFIYSDPPAGPAVKDIYLQIAYMAPSPDPGEETAGHAPLPGVVNEVVLAFGRQGIALHVDPVMAEVPHAGTVSFGGEGAACGGADSTTVDALKSGVFDPRGKFVKRFVLFSHDSCAGGTQNQNSGLAEINGNDFVVSLGGFTYAGTGPQIIDEKTREQAGSLMHELGHNLGLCHDGVADLDGSCAPTTTEQKPNYVSSMNFSYQLNGILRSATAGTVGPLDPTVPWRVDFSPAALGALNEGTLDEIGGLTGATPPADRDIARYYCLGQGPFLASGQGSIDWNCDHVYSPSALSDINKDGAITTLQGASDWNSLDYRFQCRPSFADGPDDPALVTHGELTQAVADARGVRAVPLPCQTSADCDDGNFCNGAESCQPASGLCLPGTPPSCDDANPCTADSCGAAANACVHLFAANGTPCDDGTFCTVAKTCTDGLCGGGAPRNCEDNLPCTTNACSEAQQACVVTACTFAPCWSTPVGGGVAAGPPASDAALVPPGSPSSTFVVKGNSLYALRNAGDPSGPAGSIRWMWVNPTGQAVNNFPSPVPLSSGAGEYLYLGGMDGFLYKIRASDGAQTAQADTRRASCATDQVLATPAVQLYNFSNSTFRNDVDSFPGHLSDDLVFVITRGQCGDSTRNRVIGYFAKDLSIKSVFNDPAVHKVDYGSDECVVDYTANRLYCGTNQNAGQTSQNTLWALDSGSLQVIWSHNAGSILNRPMLNGGRLYVVTAEGALMAYDPAGSATGGAVRLWTSPAITPTTVVRSPWIESRPGGWKNKILVLDSAGTLHGFTDQGSQPGKDWSVSPGPGLTFVSAPVLEPTLGKVYIGRSDGKVQQINASTGALETALPGGASGLVFDPSLEPTAGAPGGGRLTIASGNVPGSVTQFCAPAPYGSCGSDADCGAWSGPCVSGTCDPLSQLCYGRPLTDGSACSDGKPCSTGDACIAGTCRPSDVSACTCAAPGDAACGSGLTCCGGGVCANLLNDSFHCGSCGNVCSTDRVCSEGTCVAAPATCPAPSVATLATVSPGGADAIAFDRPTSAGSSCSAYLSTYQGTSGQIVRVAASGIANTFTFPGPLHGIATPREGNQYFATQVNGPGGAALMEGTLVPFSFHAASTTLPTSGAGPFANAGYNQGPVGPAFDYQTYSGSAGDSRLYYGNWTVNGDVVELRRPCPACTWAQSLVTVLPERITAIAFEVDKNPGPSQNHRFLYLGRGTTLTIVDLDLGTQKNLDLNAGTPPLGLTAILSLAVHPVYGEIFVEVKDSSGGRFLLDLDSHDLSTRRLRDVQVDLHLAPLLPPAFSTDGKLTLMPQGDLLRLTLPSALGGTPGFAGYKVTK